MQSKILPCYECLFGGHGPKAAKNGPEDTFHSLFVRCCLHRTDTVRSRSCMWHAQARLPTTCTYHRTTHQYQKHMKTTLDTLAHLTLRKNIAIQGMILAMSPIHRSNTFQLTSILSWGIELGTYYNILGGVCGSMYNCNKAISLRKR